MDLVRNGVVKLFLFYKLTLDVVYIRYVAWRMRYYHDNWSIDVYILSWLACVVILALFSQTFQKPLTAYRFSESVLFLLLLLSVIPGLAMCGAGAFPMEYIWLFYFYWGLFFLFARWLLNRDFNISAIKTQLSSKAKTESIAFLFVLIATSVIAVFSYFTGGRFFFADVLSVEIYNVRAQFDAVSLPIFLDYVMANALMVLLFLLLFFLWKRRIVLVVFILLIGCMKFSCGANKVDFFSFFVGLAVYAGRYYFTAKRIAFFSILITIIACALIDLWGIYSVMILLVRQIFATNLISYFYYDFYQKHTPFLYGFWDGDMLDKRSVTFMIGNQYMNEPTNMANNGLLGDAYQMFGEYGAVFGPVCWLGWLCLLDIMGNGYPWWIKFGISVYWVAIMQNGAFVTSLLSHGGVAMLVLAYLCSDRKEKMKCAHCQE